MGQYPWVEYLLLELLYFIFFYPTRQHTYRAIIFVAMVYLAAEIYLTSEVADTIQLQYSTGFTIPTHFMFMAHILFAEGAFPDLWRRVRDQIHPRSDVDGRDTPPSSFPLTKKLWWMLDIACGMRMIGWVQEPRNRMPPHPLPSRRTFFQKTFQKLILNIVIADLATSLLALSPPFDYRVHNPADGPETYLAAVPFLRRIPYVLTWAIGTGASVSTTHNAVALVCVGLGSNPTLWPDIWGSWGDAYTVRKLWGQTWHQTMRVMFVWLGRLIANDFLGFPRGTNLSSYTQLYVDFFLSAILHFSGDFVIEKRIVTRSFEFCLLQAVAITFEDLVIYTAKRLLRRGGNLDGPWMIVIVRAVGYCWVTLWLSLTLPIALDGLSVLGIGSADRRPISQFLLNKWNQWA